MSLADDILSGFDRSAPDPAKQASSYEDSLRRIRDEQIAGQRAREVETLRTTVAKVLEAQVEIMTAMSRLAGMVDGLQRDMRGQEEHIARLSTDTGLLTVRGQRVDEAFDALLAQVEALATTGQEQDRAIATLANRVARWESGQQPFGRRAPS